MHTTPGISIRKEKVMSNIAGIPVGQATIGMTSGTMIGTGTYDADDAFSDAAAHGGKEVGNFSNTRSLDPFMQDKGWSISVSGRQSIPVGNSGVSLEIDWGTPHETTYDTGSGDASYFSVSANKIYLRYEGSDVDYFSFSQKSAGGEMIPYNGSGRTGELFMRYNDAAHDTWKIYELIIGKGEIDEGDDDPEWQNYPATYIRISEFYLSQYFGKEVKFEEEEDPPEPVPDPNDDDPEGNSGEGGGGGDKTPSWDPIPIPPKPDKGAATAGFVTMYTMTQVFMQTFANDFFASDVWEAIRLFFGNPIDTLVGVLLVPFAPTEGQMYYMKWGTVKSHSRYTSVANQYFDVDCGEVAINEYWGSCFDYEPFTKIQIWLPYIGYRDLPVDEVMGKTIKVLYRCDCLTGDCVAFISTGVVGQTGPQVPRVIAQFYGNCGVRVPFGSVSFDNAIAAGINLMVGMAGLNTPGSSSSFTNEKGQTVSESTSYSPEIGDLSRLIGPTASVVQSMKPNVSKGGAAGASTGYMSIQKPYLIRSIARQSLPVGYKDFKGYPSNIRCTLGEQGLGYAEVEDIQLNNIPAMEDERFEILKWLKGGVLI